VVTKEERMKPAKLIRIAAVAMFCLAGTFAANGQTYNVLFNFNGGDARSPFSLTQGNDGNFYGVSAGGGVQQSGSIFKITPMGELTPLYRFCSKANCADGYGPGSLALGVNGNFYGTTNEGGTGNPNGCGPTATCGGTFFEITPSGKLTTLHNFCTATNCSDGSNPDSKPVLGDDGKYYGTAAAGGSSDCFGGCGTVYDITTDGTLETFYALQPNPLGSAGPYGVVFGPKGNLYGLQLNNGEPSVPGLVFQLTPHASFSTVYQFQGKLDGTDASTLMLGTDGNLYGLANGGVRARGTFFKISQNGEFTTLHTFCQQIYCTDGYTPVSVIEGSDGNFYGVTIFGGNKNKVCQPYLGCGTIFRITPAGEFTVLHTFCSVTSCTDGAEPQSLVQATDGTFYGVTNSGGPAGKCYLGKGCGIIFTLSVGLPAFVQANPGFGAAGHVVNVLGNSLTGTSSVTFNGVAAQFKVVSDTYLEAQVPAGATTGKIEVTTPGGTLESNFAFQVLP
jgi:uncharacterized repeat protein (TIGR03803 family)